MKIESIGRLFGDNIRNTLNLIQVPQLYTNNDQTPHTWVQPPPQAPASGYPQFYTNYGQVAYPMFQPMNMPYTQWYHY